MRMPRCRIGLLCIAPLCSTLLGIASLCSPVAAEIAQPRLRFGGADDPHPLDSVRVVALSPDGTLAAVAGEPETPTDDLAVQLRETATGRLRHRLGSHERPIRAIGFAADGKGLATLTADADGHGTLRWFDVTTGELLWTAPRGGRALRFLNESRLAVAGAGRVWFFNTRTGREFIEYSTVTPVVKDLTADARLVLGVSHEGRSVLEVRAKGAAQATAYLSGCVAEPAAAAISFDGRTVAAADPKTRQVWFWEVVSSQKIAHAETDTMLFTLAFTPDGRHVVGGGLDGTLRVWEVASGAEVGRRRVHPGAVTALAIAADGTAVLTGGSDRTAAWWSLSELLGTALPTDPATPSELDAGWRSLVASDAAAAYHTLGRAGLRDELRHDLLSRAMQQVAPVPAEDVARLIAELDAADFRDRERAMQTLAAGGESLRPDFETALAAATSPEVQGRLRLLLRRITTVPRFSPGDLLRFRRLIPTAATAGKPGRDLLRRLVIAFPNTVVNAEAAAALQK